MAVILVSGRAFGNSKVQKRIARFVYADEARRGNTPNGVSRFKIRQNWSLKLRNCREQLRCLTLVVSEIYHSRSPEVPRRPRNSESDVGQKKGRV